MGDDAVGRVGGVAREAAAVVSIRWLAVIVMVWNSV